MEELSVPLQNSLPIFTKAKFPKVHIRENQTLLLFQIEDFNIYYFISKLCYICMRTYHVWKVCL